MTDNNISGQSVGNRRGLIAISPIAVFLVLYVAVSVIAGDFYKMPIAVAFVAASVWAVAIFRGHSLTERLEVFSRAAGHSNIIYMLWVFILAGAFASLARETGSVEATVDFTLSVMPPEWIVPGLFIAACFISLAVGTSVGTVVALAPLAVDFAASGGESVAFYIAVVLGGAFFGDNLSFISDTTIAATRSQGCEMADKFKANIWLTLPAALVTLVIYALISASTTPTVSVAEPRSALLLLPYFVVIVTAILRINVTIVLLLGIAASCAVALIDGHCGVFELLGHMGSGIDSMGNLIIITLLSAGMLGIIKAAGGIDWLLQRLTAHVAGPRGGQACIAVLVSVVNLCTANNTVAIITAGPISRAISQRFGIDPRKSASLLDTCSCIIQCLIPYGAQTLLATSLAGISPASPFPYLYYPWALAAVVVLSVVFRFPRPVAR